jgi:hypothetical protein
VGHLIFVSEIQDMKTAEFIEREQKKFADVN